MRDKKLILSIAVVALACVAVYLVARKQQHTSGSKSSPVVPTSSASPAAPAQPAVAVSQPVKAMRAGKLMPPTAVALVNGVPITSADLDDELSNLLTSPTGHAAVNQFGKDASRKAALEELIVRELAYQRAKASGLTVEKKRITATVKKIKRRYQTEKSFQEALRVEEMSEQEFERRIEKDLLLRKISKVELEDKSRVTRAEARSYYEANKAKFVLPESLRLFRIMIKAAAENNVKARETIDDIFAKLKAGADFGELAYKFSQDDYRVMSGDYGTVHRGQLPADLEVTVFAAKQSTLIGPLRDSEGWQIIRVENKQAERQLRFEEVREKITTALRLQREKQRRLDFINELKALAKIEYLK